MYMFNNVNVIVTIIPIYIYIYTQATCRDRQGSGYEQSALCSRCANAIGTGPLCRRGPLKLPQQKRRDPPSPKAS